MHMPFHQTCSDSLGAPFLLPALRRKKGVVLVHSYLAVPEEVRGALLSRIRDHLTPHGLATEKLDSPNYVEGGYWRGPIWAPSTMLVTSGLQEIGEHELAQSIMKSFCDMCAANGFYENFDPVTITPYLFRDLSLP